jgi:hypothetical protein
MNEKIQTSANELEVGTQFVFNAEPTGLEVARGMVVSGISRAVEHVKLETRMIAFDALHNTNYRAVRHNLIAQRKREAFERSIGLIAVDK